MNISKISKIIILVSLCSFQLGFAQMNTKGSKQIMFSVFTNNAQLVFSNYIKDGFAMRYFISGGYTQDRGLMFSDHKKVLGTTYEEYTHKMNLSLGIGFQKSIVKFENKLDIYAGLDIKMGNNYYKKYNEEIVIDSLLYNMGPQRGYQNGDYRNATTLTPVSIALNAVPFVGFKYFVHPRLAFGAECRLDFFNLYFTPQTYYKSESMVRGRLFSSESGANAMKAGIGFGFNTTANITVTLVLNKKAAIVIHETEK